LIGTESFDGLGAFGLGEKSCGSYAIVEFPVHEGGCNDSDKTDEEEDTILCQYEAKSWNMVDIHLPRVKCVGLDMPQSVRYSSSKDCSQPICAIPSRYSNRLLSSTVPLICDDTE
jgi:hypothetical protein